LEKMPPRPVPKTIGQIAKSKILALGGGAAYFCGPTRQLRTSRLGLLALATLSLHWLAMGTVLISLAGFERYCQAVDGSSALARLETIFAFGPVAVFMIADYRAMKTQQWLWAWQMHANRLLTLLSLGYLTVHVAFLRAPWLLGEAGGSDRITLWSARLSSTVAGVPILAFALTVGLGVTLRSIVAACLRAFSPTENTCGGRMQRNYRTVLWSLCALVFLVGLATIAAFATGA
jgi:hypothetical protein